jgi:hypothetical protein
MNTLRTANIESLSGDFDLLCAKYTWQDRYVLQKRDWKDETGRWKGRKMKKKRKKGGKLRQSKDRIKMISFNFTKRNIRCSYPRQ